MLYDEPPSQKVRDCGNGSRPPVENGEAAGETGDFARKFAGRAKTVPDPFLRKGVDDEFGRFVDQPEQAAVGQNDGTDDRDCRR